MWVALAFGSAFFAGLTSVLAKAGIKNINSNLATAVRTVVVVVFAWLMVFITDSFTLQINTRSLIFLTLSGITTGASWLCYFKALKIGDISKVVPIDKSSTVLTMMLAFLLLGEGLTIAKFICMILIAAGTFMMTVKRRQGSDVAETSEVSGNSDEKPKKTWVLYALLAAIFASLTAILGKIGITDIDATLGTAIRTIVVLLVAWAIVFMQGEQRNIKQIDKKSGLFLVLSGLATGACWLFFYSALQLGPASVVVPIDKLSIVITIVFGVIMFKEKLKFKSVAGLALIVIGTIWLIFT